MKTMPVKKRKNRKDLTKAELNTTLIPKKDKLRKNREPTEIKKTAQKTNVRVTALSTSGKKKRPK